MLITDVGPVLFHKGIAVPTLSLAPLTDRSAVVRRILIDNPSANDVWIVSINGQELTRYPIYIQGNQQLLGGSAANYPKTSDIFAFARIALGIDISYPLPNANTMTVYSLGGATANVSIGYEEHSIGDINSGMVNHPQGQHFLFPVFLVPANNNTSAVAAEFDFASQIAPSWLPNFFGNTYLPNGWNASIIALFLEGAAVNTYSGAANHVSATDHLALTVDGTRYFTRDAVDGIPNVGPIAAAGSANTVYGTVTGPYPAFQLVEYVDWTKLPVPIRLNSGMPYRFQLGLSGDATGGADYHLALQCLLVDIMRPGGM